MGSVPRSTVLLEPGLDRSFVTYYGTDTNRTLAYFYDPVLKVIEKAVVADSTNSVSGP